MSRFSLVVVLVAALAFAGPADRARAADVPPGAPTAPHPSLTPPSLRLPDGARPLRYEADLTVVPGAPKAAGTLVIDLELARDHPVLWLDADALDVTRASVDGSGVTARVSSGHDPFVGIAFDPPLPAGRHRLTIAYEAEQSRNSTRGIFALEEGGAWYAMTQFEPMGARRAFPCFDEPGFKVPWQLTLHVPRNLVAVSNTPVASETDEGTDMKRVRFAPTRPLPTYLVAFAVGPWVAVDLGRLGAQPTPMRVIVPRGRTAEAAFAARAFPELFTRMETWFGIAHPYPKLDHIAIPLTVGFAMENAGLITYGAPTLLARPDAVSASFRHRVASVGAHEMAHQWFGNLVTTAWWDDIWLNEAFATWFAAKMVDAWRPDYERGAARIEERAKAMADDALVSARRIREPIVERGDISNAFDAITYQKGATVIGMFEGWIGEAALRRGVQRYLQARRDGSATVHDFLDALERASGKPVAPAFSSFLDQNGVPEVAVSLECTAGRPPRLALAQKRHSLLGAASSAGTQRWQIPLCVRYGDEHSARETCTLFAEEAVTLPLEGACPAFVNANAGGRGYYLPAYRGDLLARLDRHRVALAPAELASLLYDLRALVRSGTVSAATALDWVRAGGASGDRHVVVAAVELATFVRDTLVEDADRARYAAFVRDVFGARARALGFAPKADEGDDDALVRRSLLEIVAAEDPALAADARRLAVAWMDQRKALDPGMVDTVLVAAARTGDAALLEAMLRAAHTATDRLDRRSLMTALFSFRDPALAARGLAALLDPAFDIRELTTALWNSHRDGSPQRATHDFIVAHFDALAGRVARDTPGGWPVFAEQLCSERDRADVEAFWRERIGRYAGGERNLAFALESIASCTKLHAAQHAAVADYLAGR